MTDELTDQMIAKTESYVRSRAGVQAVESANELAEVDPKDAIVWYLKGKAHYISGEFDEALGALSKAASLQPDKPDIWLVMGFTLIAMRRYTEALPSLEFVRGSEPDNAQASTALCVLHIILGNMEQAQACFTQAMGSNKSVTVSMLEHFHHDFFDVSPAVEANTKAVLGQMLESARLGK